jgi:hypothetical protein
MKQRIIFIDIDGPIINRPCYYVDIYASVKRSVMNTQAIGYINKLAKLASARIATNSTHNNFTVKETGRTLRDDLIKWGLKTEYIHENWCTTFPWPDLVSDPLYPTHRRLRGIMEWEQENGEADWIAFDDEPFVENDPRLMHVDFELGIDYNLFVKACEHWNINPESNPESLII